MPLTPIHVRGKRKVATKMDSVASSSETPESSGGANTKPKKKSRGADTSRRGSILERLPVELLVMVFTESQNMGLLFCSRHIHTALNNHYSHVRLVAQAFAPTWSIYHGRRRLPAAKRLIPTHKPCEDIVARQEELIRKKFFTIDLVLAAQQIWYDMYQPDNKRLHFLESCDPGGDCDHCRGGLEAHVFNARDCFEHDFRLAKASVSEEKEGWLQFRNLQDVEPGVVLGPEIMYGPWDEKHEKLVFWLVTSGTYVNPADWDLESPSIVYSHTSVNSEGEASANSFFTYGARDLVTFDQWPKDEGYNLYLRVKPPPGSDKWAPGCRKLNEYLRYYSFLWNADRRIREIRRAAGRDVNDSDLPYDPDNDSGDSDLEWW